MRLIELDECDSTNTYLASIASDSPHGTVVTARRQTAGRGQRGNSWESAPDVNITMSILLRAAGLHPSRQFLLSEAVSLAVVGVLHRYLHGSEVKIKWPNDIYVADGKICGILIENSITPSGINHAIVGLGINVNQLRFVSDAPNPVSMAQIAGREFDVRTLALEFASEILREVEMAVAQANSPLEKSEVRQRYFDSLWRTDGLYAFRDNLRGELIEARVESVGPDGIITLRLSDGSARSYAFKEISAVVKESLL